MVLMGAADAVSRRARQMNVPASSYLLAQSPFFVATSLAATLLAGRFDFSMGAIGFASLSGALAFSAMAFLTKSLKTGQASVNVAVFRMNFVLAAGLAMVIFKEPRTWHKLAGLALAVVAIGAFFVSLQGRRAVEMRAMAFALVGMVLATGMQLTWAWAAKVAECERGSFVLIQSIVFAALAAAYAWWEQHLKVPRKAVKYAAANGVLLALGTLAVLASVAKGEASICIPITQLSFVVTAALAIIFLHEKLTPAKVVGSLLAIGAIVLLAMSPAG